MGCWVGWGLLPHPLTPSAQAVARRSARPRPLTGHGSGPTGGRPQGSRSVQKAHSRRSDAVS